MATSYFSRTPASAGNRKTFTISFWQKRSKISYNYDMMIGTAYSAGAGNSLQIFFDNTDKLIIQAGDGSWGLSTTQVFRDTSAWYHIVYAVDTTQATSSNRIKLYVNGSQVTSFSTATYMSQNLDTAWNNTIVQKVGDFGLNYLEGYLANVINVDGTALDATSFGQTDTDTGIWKPKSYTGSYGTNGFFLKFENSGSLGTDSSGNGNNFTVNGTPTQTVDTPSNVFCTLNALSKGSGVSLTNGNLTETNDTTWRSVMSTLAVSKGKWYWEAKVASLGTINFGITKSKQDGTTHDSVDAGRAMWSSNGNFYDEGFSNSTVSVGTFTTNDVIGLALDCDNGTLKFYKNNTLTYTFTNAGLTTNEVTPASGLNNATGNFNFGNGYFGSTAISSPYSDGAGLGKFQYTVPTGYYALCTKNINVYG